jgi:hypothetical protein
MRGVVLSALRLPLTPTLSRKRERGRKERFIGAHGEGGRLPVIPAKTGIQHSEALSYWIPAFAGMTGEAPMWRTPRDEAIQQSRGRGPGLLRFARNDVEIGTDGKVREHAARCAIAAHAPATSLRPTAVSNAGSGPRPKRASVAAQRPSCRVFDSSGGAASVDVMRIRVYFCE